MTNNAVSENSTIVSQLAARRGHIGVAAIRGLADSAQSHASTLRREVLAPDSKKYARMFTSAQVGVMCGIDLAQMKYRVSKGDLPAGFVGKSGTRRMFTLPEAREWAREYRKESMRPADQQAVTIAVANFKGGVTKTSTAMVLAQGLSVRGHRVLAIDLDPQGSLTTLHGVLPETDVIDEMTAFPVFRRETDSIRSAIRKTYWDGIDLVASATLLYGAEFQLASMPNTNPDSRFWSVLDKSLNSVREDYDIIILDTPPSLGFIAVNGLWAADGLLIPIPPTGLDFASSTQFWKLLANLGESLDSKSSLGEQKKFEFLSVLLSRVDSTDSVVPYVRDWISAVYGKYVLPLEIPRTSVTTNQAAEYATVYDIERYEGSDKTYRRAFDAYERLVELMEQSCVTTWRERGKA